MPAGTVRRFRWCSFFTISNRFKLRLEFNSNHQTETAHNFTTFGNRC